MEINWAEALKVGGIGFGMVFAVLALLAVAIWLIGLLMMKLDARDKKAAEDKAAAAENNNNNNDEDNGE